MFSVSVRNNIATKDLFMAEITLILAKICLSGTASRFSMGKYIFSSPQMTEVLESLQDYIHIRCAF